MSPVSTIKMTARQFLELGEDPAGIHLELVDGEVAVSPSPIPNHSFAVVKLIGIIDRYVTDEDLGQVFTDVDTIFGPHDVRRPDLIYFAKARLHLVGKKAIEGPPDLCVEVLSPSSTSTDRVDKFNQYAAAGVVNYWIVNPRDRTVESFVLRDGRYDSAARGQGQQTVRLAPFPDLDIPLARLWRPE